MRDNRSSRAAGVCVIIVSKKLLSSSTSQLHTISRGNHMF